MKESLNSDGQQISRKRTITCHCKPLKIKIPNILLWKSRSCLGISTKVWGVKTVHVIPTFTFLKIGYPTAIQI